MLLANEDLSYVGWNRTVHKYWNRTVEGSIGSVFASQVEGTLEALKKVGIGAIRRRKR